MPILKTSNYSGRVFSKRLQVLETFPFQLADKELLEFYFNFSLKRQIYFLHTESLFKLPKLCVFFLQLFHLTEIAICKPATATTLQTRQTMQVQVFAMLQILITSFTISADMLLLIEQQQLINKRLVYHQH